MKETDFEKPKIPSLWWRDAIAKVLFLYVVFQFLRQILKLVKSFEHSGNPIIPKTLAHYIAFPHYFLLIYWAAACILFFNFTRNNKLQQTSFWIIPVSLVGFLLGSFFLYLFLMEVNPFD